jgi:6-phosphogluconolactonase
MKTKIHVSLVGALIACASFTANTIANAQESGAVYTMSNRAKANSVLVYQRAPDGRLTFVQEAPTKGLGTGVTQDPLMSQGALTTCQSGGVLLAVNPGSGELSAFRVTDTGLEFGSKVLSGGDFPVSVTVHNNTVYVLNQLGIANVSGFTVNSAAQLVPIPNSTYALAGRGLAQPAEVSFTPDGTQVLVTEKGTDLIDIFAVQADGHLSGPDPKTSTGSTPFGFAFGPNGSVIVSEAEKRLPQKGTSSSYQLGPDGTLTAVGRAIRDRQTAACWVAITGQTAFVVNTLTSTISSYQIDGGAGLTLLNAVAATTGVATTPTDAAISMDGRYLYVLKSATGEIAAFQINGSSLTPSFTEKGLPLSIAGIVAR